MAMLERVVYSVIKTGIEAFQNDPLLIDDLFDCELLLDPAEAEDVRQFFLAKPPDVIHGYARPDSNFPLYSITLGAFGNPQGFIGDEGAMETMGAEKGTDEWASIFSYVINVLVYAEHPDVCLYYWHILRAILINGDDVLKQADMFAINYSGSDMAPDPAWVPAGLFLRRFTVSCQRQYAQALKSTKLGKAFKVAGLHVIPDGAPGEDIGGVKAFVVPISPAELEDDGE